MKESTKTTRRRVSVSTHGMMERCIEALGSRVHSTVWLSTFSITKRRKSKLSMECGSTGSV